MAKRQKVVKFRRRREINIGIVIFLILFLYISINVYIFLTKDHISIYEVKVGSNVEDTVVPAIVLRDEEVVTSKAAGYITYYVKDGSRVAKNSSIYSTDDSRSVYDYILSQDNPIKLTKKNSNELKQTVNTFYKTYSDSDFASAFDYQELIENKVSIILSNEIIDQSVDISAETGLTSNIQVTKTDQSGIISYFYDGYEDLEEAMINEATFEGKSNYQRTSLRTAEIVGVNDPVYRSINSDKWDLILPLTSEQYTALFEKTSLTFTIMKDNFTVTAPISFFQNGGKNYAKISMDKYIQNYLNDRFLEIDIKLHQAEGLKIPVSSIIEKEFYLIPLEYFTIGSDSAKTGVVEETYNEGIASYSFKETEIYHQNEEYGYVDSSEFSLGMKLHSPTTNETFTLSQMAKLTGVYNVNKGYAVFRRIEVLYENNEYCIIKMDTENGLSNYDHIALNADRVIEDAIIY